MAMPDSACREIDVRTEFGKQRYAGDRSGTFTVEDSRHTRMLLEQGAFPANLGGTPAVEGFPCPCGFVSYFVRCSRCGADNPRTEE